MALGSTVGDLQNKMTYMEFDLWCQYRSKYGPLDPVRRFDRGPALVTSMIANVNGGKAVPNDFIPYGKALIEDSEEEFITQLMATGKARMGR